VLDRSLQAALIAAASITTLAVASDAASGAPPPAGPPPAAPPAVPLLPAAPPPPPDAAAPPVTRIAITGGVLKGNRATLEVQCLRSGTATFAREGRTTSGSERWVCTHSHSQVRLVLGGSDMELARTRAGLHLRIVLRSGQSTLHAPLFLHDVARATTSARRSAAAAPCPGSVSRYVDPVFGRCWELVGVGAVGNADTGAGGRIRVAPAGNETLGARPGEQVWWRALVYWYGPRLRQFDWWAPPDELAAGGWHSYVPRRSGATNIASVSGQLTNIAPAGKPVAASLDVPAGIYYWPVIQSYSASNGYATFTVYARYGRGSGSVAGDNWIYFTS
jgi:hypothetical protein